MSSSAFFLERDSNGSWATCNPYNQQLFFCINNECSNIASAGEQCDSCNGGNETEYDRWESTLTREPNWDTSECPGCGREQHGAMLGSNGYCGPCWQQRYGLLACYDTNLSASEFTRCMDAESLRMCRKCNAWYNIKDGDADEDGERPQCYQCDKYDWDEACAEQAEYDIWCGLRSSRCSCNRETGLMCYLCAEECGEPCRTCGVNSQLWTDEKHCRQCFINLHGYEFPPRTIEVVD